VNGAKMSTVRTEEKKSVQERGKCGKQSVIRKMGSVARGREGGRRKGTETCYTKFKRGVFRKAGRMKLKGKTQPEKVREKKQHH